MNTAQELNEFINNLENPIVKFDWITGYDTIDLKILVKDIHKFNSVQEWINSLELTNTMLRHIIKVLMQTNPPEIIKNELLLISL
jgi:hypothetical protein